MTVPILIRADVMIPDGDYDALIKKGTRPYKHVPVQWSVHIDDGKGDGSLASVQHKEFLDLQAPLMAIVERIYDLANVTKQYYYHPDMHGSWSLKYIGPSIASSINYKELGEVNEGMAAANFFLEAVHPETTPERKADLEKKLLKYCWVDTAAMVEIVRFLQGRN